MPIVKANAGVWCDYCKNRFGNKSHLAQKGAVVTVISERRSRGHYRSYCNDCLLLVTHWNCDCKDYRNCKSRFDLQEQINYGKEVQGELLDGI